MDEIPAPTGSGGGFENYPSDSNGVYTVRAMPPGTYDICFTAHFTPDVSTGFTGYAAQCNGNTQVSNGGTLVTITAGHVTSGVDASLAQGWAVTGRVTDASGNPISGVGVYATGVSSTGGSNGYDSSWPYLASTDPGGNYSIGNLAPGTQYKICFDASGVGGGSSGRGYANQCYDDVSPTGTPTLITGTAGSFIDNVNATLASH